MTEPIHTPPGTPCATDPLQQLLASFEQLAAGSTRLRREPSLVDTTGPEIVTLPCYSFRGPSAGSELTRVGIFGGIHGDEPESAIGLVRFVRDLEAKPSMAEGYCLYIYPVCNPRGFSAGTRNSPAGVDLNREFWRESAQPEVRLLEQELKTRAFEGIISLHGDDTSHGLYGFVSGSTLTKYLLNPALKAASRALPLNAGPVIDGFNAEDSMIFDGYHGILSAPPEQKPHPFQIVFEVPHLAPAEAQDKAFALALETMLTEYRQLVAYSINL